MQLFDEWVNPSHIDLRPVFSVQQRSSKPDSTKRFEKNERHNCKRVLTLQAPIPQNGQTYSNNSLAVTEELLECLTILWDCHIKG